MKVGDLVRVKAREGSHHHQDLYEHNLKYNEAEYHAQELLLQEEEEMYGGTR